MRAHVLGPARSTGADGLLHRFAPNRFDEAHPYLVLHVRYEKHDTHWPVRSRPHREAVRPVCSPAYAAAHAHTLAGPVTGWSELTFLDLLRPNEGWAAWEDWFAVAGSLPGAPRRLGLDSYTYVLEAAAAGHGIALGWRYFIERPLESGALVALGDGFVEFDRAYYSVLTDKGRRKPLARQCLAFFDRAA